MKRKLISAMISTSLIIPGTVMPMPVWAYSGMDLAVPQSVTEAQAKWEQGSAGFFQYLADQGDADAELAYQIITATDNSLQDGAKRSTDYSSCTKLGQDRDATSLDNMMIAIGYLEKCNEKRQEENQTMNTSLSDLRVSSSLMAISQWQTNASNSEMEHSQAFSVSEDLAWGYSDPFTGWYTSEKAIFLKALEDGETPNFYEVGHYLNIVDPDYLAMGTAYVTSSGTLYGRAEGIVFSERAKYTSKTYTVAEYKELFVNYYNDLRSQLEVTYTDLSSAIVSRINDQYEYRGESISPVPTVTLNGTVLRKDTDYTVSWSNNIAPGTATITITGIGNYIGTLSTTFEILTPAKTDLSSGIVSGINDRYEYRGESISPVPTVTLNGTVLRKDTDYTVSWSNNTEPGTAIVTITGIGDYTGTLSTTFEILASAKTDISSAILSGISADYEYEGQAISPVPVVTLNGTILREGTDYTVSWSDNDQPGTASIVITGIGDYTGLASTTFEITQSVLVEFPVEDPNIIHSGKIGTADWTIDKNGTLTIGEGEFSNDDKYYYWPWNDYKSLIKHVDGTANFKISGSLSKAFDGVWYLATPSTYKILSADLSGWDVSEVTDLSDMFAYQSKLESINVSSWDISNVTSLDNTFGQCRALKSIDVSSWDTSSVTNMSSTFGGCESLVSIDVSSWNTSNVHEFRYMFGSCESLVSLDLNSWDTSSGGTMMQMFQNCGSLRSLNISSWNVSNVYSMWGMFDSCSKLTSLNLDTWNVYHVHEMESMFNECNALTDLKLGNWNPYYIYSVSRMFYNCYSLNELDISKFGASHLDDGGDVEALTGCRSLNRIWYSQESKALLNSLDDQSGWYLNNNNGPYNISDLPDVDDGQTAYLFRIIPQRRPINGKSEISGINISYTYTGKPITPIPALLVGGQSLVNGTDYRLSYSNNINPGTATITITGMGDYTGTITKTFSIVKAAEKPTTVSINTASVSGVNSQYTYTGKAITPKPVVKVGNKTLAEGKDYKLSYSNNVNAGTATVTITGMGGYTGTVKKTFSIVKAAEKPTTVAISTASVSGVNAQYTFTGKAIVPKPVVKVGNKTLAEGKDYKLSYSNNVNPGTATITITGMSSYTGSIKKTFAIIKTAAEPVAKPVNMHRLYNPNSGEHFYTANTGEKDHLVKVGWKYEGEGWKAPDQSKTPVYRLYNPNAGDHHYTMDKNERDTLVKIGWNDEGIGWYSDDSKSVPLYRQYNPNAQAGSHNYTTDKGENDGLVRLGWQAEGIGWYGMK